MLGKLRNSWRGLGPVLVAQRAWTRGAKTVRRVGIGVVFWIVLAQTAELAAVTLAADHVGIATGSLLGVIWLWWLIEPLFVAEDCYIPRARLW